MKVTNVKPKAKIYQFNRSQYNEENVTDYIEAPNKKEAIERASCLGIAASCYETFTSWDGGISHDGWHEELTYAQQGIMYRLHLDDGRQFYFNNSIPDKGDGEYVVKYEAESDYDDEEEDPF